MSFEIHTHTPHRIEDPKANVANITQPKFIYSKNYYFDY